MNRQKLFPLLQDPSKTQLRDAGWLNDLAATYPYSPLVRSLLAKAFQYTKEEDAYKQTAALYMADRRVLKQLMEGTFSVSPLLSPQAEALPASEEIKQEAPAEKTETAASPEPVVQEHLPQQPVQEDTEAPQHTFTEEATVEENSEEEAAEAYQQSSVVSELEENLARLRKQREQLMHLFEDDDDQTDAEPKIQESEEEEVVQAPQAFSTEGLPDVVKELAHDLQPKELEDPTKKRQVDLINSFLQRSSSLQRKYRDARNEPESPQADLTRHYAFSADHTVTETMARLMEKQGRTEKAVEIYEKLSLKYPDKKAYFASCIEKLKHSN